MARRAQRSSSSHRLWPGKQKNLSKFIFPVAEYSHPIQRAIKLNDDGRLLALDKDLEAVKEGETIKDKRFEIVHASFKDLKDILKKKIFKNPMEFLWT